MRQPNTTTKSTTERRLKTKRHQPQRLTLNVAAVRNRHMLAPRNENSSCRLTQVDVDSISSERSEQLA